MPGFRPPIPPRAAAGSGHAGRQSNEAGKASIRGWWRCSRRYLRARETGAKVAMSMKRKLSTDVKIERGARRPPVLKLRSLSPATTSPRRFPHSIAAARQEVQPLFELTQDLGNSLSLDETLSVLASG